jgi:hypothetical protein
MAYWLVLNSLYSDVTVDMTDATDGAAQRIAVQRPGALCTRPQNAPVSEILPKTGKADV